MTRVRWFRRAVLCVAVVISFGVGCTGDDDAPTAATAPTSDDELIELAISSGNGNPADVELPAPTDDSTAAWLEGDGAAAVALVTATEALWRDGDGACATVSNDLEAAGSPEELLAAASATPDAVTNELLVDLHAAVVRALAACNEATEFGTALAAFAWQWALADRRLDELGVVR